MNDQARQDYIRQQRNAQSDDAAAWHGMAQGLRQELDAAKAMLVAKDAEIARLTAKLPKKR